MPSLQEVAETFVCAPMTRPERLRPLPKDRQRPQTFLFGQSGIHQPVFARSPVLLSKPASRMLSMKRLRRWRDLQLLRWQSHLRGAFCHAFKTTNWSSKQTFIRSLLKEKRSRSCLTAEAECHHLGSSPTAQKDSEPPWYEVSESLSNAQVKRPERLWPLPLARQSPQTFLMDRAVPEDCHSASASSS